MQYSHINHLSSKQIDLGVISDAIDLCQAGRLFYTQTVADADDYNIKRIFMDMAETKRCMLQQLVPLLQQVKQNEIAPYNVEPISFFSFTDEYVRASEAIKQDRLWVAIGRLLEIEQQALHQLRWAARQAANKQVAEHLAEGSAWLQMGCDSMKSLYVSRKSATN